MKARILIVEDDRQIAEVLKQYLEKLDYEVSWASTGKEGLDDFKKTTIDLLIIDIMLPEMDGYTLCRNIRWISEVPILIISAKNAELDKVKGLKLGADDYVTKPFSLLEVEARIESLLRRVHREMRQYGVQNTLSYEGGLVINQEEKKAYLNGEDLFLTAKEYGLLLLLAQNAYKTFSKEEIYEHIWQGEVISVGNIVTVHIKYLRAKLADNSKKPKYIETVWGMGYRFIGSRLE